MQPPAPAPARNLNLALIMELLHTPQAQRAGNNSMIGGDWAATGGQDRGISRISQVSMTSSGLMSLNFPSPIPHS